MDTCFLFTKHLDAEGCLVLKLSQTGEILSQPAQLSFKEIHNLQAECRTIVVETSKHAAFQELDLPWLPDRKARIAIPYALEEKLAEPIESLHFSFDKQHYQNNKYLISVLGKDRALFIVNTLDEHEIEFELLTLDWFALSINELCVTESTLLVYNEDFKGALSGELATNYLNNHSANEVLVFLDSTISCSATKKEEHSYIWLARRLLSTIPMNLCQGALLHRKETNWIKSGYQACAVLLGIWLVSLLMVNAISIYSLNKKNHVLEEQIAVIYHQFFPEAKQVISPKFRIQQLLKNNISDAQAHFWFIFNQFAKVFQSHKLTIEQLKFQSGKLSVTLVSPDFPSLEDFQNKLKQSEVKVKQTQASTRDQQVIATLELS